MVSHVREVIDKSVHAISLSCLSSGFTPLSLISFQVAQSNIAKCQSIALSGHTTSPVHTPSCISAVVVQFLSVIVTVAVLHTLLTVAVGEYQSVQGTH